MSDPAPVPATEPLTEPTFECFTVWMSSGSDPGTMPERANEALRLSLAAFAIPAEGWEVAAVHPSQPGMFDLLPPATGGLTVKQAWDVAYALLEQPSVVDVEPSFEILQDNADALTFHKEEDDEAAEAEGAAASTGALAGAIPSTDPPIFSKALRRSRESPPLCSRELTPLA